MALNFRAAFERALGYEAFLERYGNPTQRGNWAAVYNAVKLTGEQTGLLGSFKRKMPVLCLAGVWCGDCVNQCPILQRIAEASGAIDLRFVHREQKFDATPVQAISEPAAPPPGDIRTTPMAKILIKWGIITPERVEKALLQQEEEKARGLNVRIGDVMTAKGWITADERDRALAFQAGFTSLADADRQLAMELSICGAPRVPMAVFLSEDWYECARFGDRTLAVYRDKIAKMQGASCPLPTARPDPNLLASSTAEWVGQFERVQLMLLTSARLMKLHGEM